MDSTQRTLARGWLVLGIAALLASGVFSVLLVALRTPGVQSRVPGIDFFRTALVVHVDLSVLIWFLAFGGVLWTLARPPRRLAAERAALGAAALGTAGVTLAAFFPDARPLLNNYVPILQQPVFFAGLTLFALGCLVKCVLVAGDIRHLPTPLGDAAVRAGSLLGALITLLALLALLWTWLRMPATGSPTHYFEVLFWGPGHILQFAYTVLMLAAWLWLVRASRPRAALGDTAGVALMVLAALPALTVGLWLLVSSAPGSARSTAGFARLMSDGGLLAVPLLIATALAALRGPGPSAAQRPAWTGLLCSLLLFTAGGVLGFLIRGVNVVIPAHYHGSIVGVTLAFMGLTYHLLPVLGYRAPPLRLATWQPLVYAAGQLLHITGLAISGGYGVARKTAGLEQGLDSLPKLLGMGLMGLGGLIAIIGGLLFVIVVLWAMCPRREGPANGAAAGPGG